MATARYSVPSRRDLIRIWKYIATDSVTNADQWYDRIIDRCDRLALHPMIGEACPHLRAALRRTTVGNYVIYYEHRDYGVFIVRILHGAQDETAQF